MNNFVASWDGRRLALCYAARDNISRFEDVDVVDGLPQLPVEDAVADKIYWPLESLLVRPFKLPLGDPRFLDAAILAQEVLESAGAHLDAWWLAWQAERCEEGIAGVVFGLPASIQRAMQSQPVWQGCSAVLVDGLERLVSMRVQSEAPARAAILDADREGLFFGYCRDGAWRGLRRLNWQDDGACDEDRAQQIVRTLTAMGFDADAEPVCGAVDAQMAPTLAAVFGQWHVKALDAPADRNTTTLALEGASSGLNFRHGRWAVRDWSSVALWRRPLLLAATVVLVWSAAMVAETLMLKSQARQYEQQIAGAFRTAVPDGPEVGPDYQMELLRKRAGVSSGGGDARRLLPELNALARAWSEQHWQIQEIDFRNGRIQLSGEVKTLDDLEKIKAALQEGLGKSVTIDDTKLADNSVNFRIHW